MDMMPTDTWSEPVRGLLLDVDDTLLDTQSAMRESCTVGAAAAWPGESASTHERLSSVFYDDPRGHFDAYTRGEFDFVRMRRARYEVACIALGLEPVGFETFESAYLEAYRHCQRQFGDVGALLAAADRAGVRIAYVTNSGTEQTHLKLAASGLPEDLPLATTDTLGVGKPDPEIFSLALEQIGVGPHEALVVGDTLHTDIVGARNAGMRAAWLQRPDVPEPRNAGWDMPAPDSGVRIIAGLDEVVALL